MVLRNPQIHVVKSWPHLFMAALSGNKTHEMRRHDRDYAAGDLLLLREYDPHERVYSGRDLLMHITYVTSSKNPCALSDAGLAPGFCILSVQRVVAG